MTAKYTKEYTYLQGSIRINFDEDGKFIGMYLGDKLTSQKWRLPSSRHEAYSRVGLTDDIRELFIVLDAIKEEIGLDLLAKED